MLPHDSIRPLRLVAAAIVLAALPHCASDRSASPFAATGDPAPASTSAPTAMGGRWVLSSATGGSCSMTFGGEPGAREGTIAPEGGCPDRFFTSRKWTFEQGALFIRDHNGRPLAQLATTSPERFEGKSAIGPAVTLAR